MRALIVRRRSSSNCLLARSKALRRVIRRTRAGGTTSGVPSASASSDPPDEGRDHDREVELPHDRLQAGREASGWRDGNDVAEAYRGQRDGAEVLEDGDQRQ